jgi:hypothetical protein
MLRRFSSQMSSTGSVRHYVQLQSESYCKHLSEKIVRKSPASAFYNHPCWVMSREKMLNTIWVDQGIFLTSVKFLVPFFAIATFFKA